MPESKRAWKPLKSEFEKRGWPADRIENSAKNGMPDVIVSVRASVAGHVRDTTETWIELKDAKLGGNICLELRKEQFLWLREAVLRYRRALLVARIGEDWYLFNTVEGFEIAKKAVPVAVLQAEAVYYGDLNGLCNWLYIWTESYR